MSELTQTVQTTRKFLIGFVIFSILAIGYQYIRENLMNNENNKPGPSTVSPYLVPTKTSTSYTRFKLNSLTTTNSNRPEFVKVGEFVKLPNSINVYKIEEKKVSLSALKTAEKTAADLGLESDYETINSSIYRWESNDRRKSLEYNSITKEIRLRSDLYKARSQKIDPAKEEEDFQQFGSNLLATLGIDLDVFSTNPRVDYIDVNADQSIIEKDKAEATLVRLTFFKKLESSTLLTQFQNREGFSNVVSEVWKSDLLSGSLTIIMNGEASSSEDVIYLDYAYNDLIPNPQPQTNTSNSKSAQYAIDVFPLLEAEAAFEKIKAGDPTSFLAFMKLEDENIFETYTPVGVRKFSISANKTKVIYIEPNNWDHIDKNNWNATYYPFVWFEGLAQLENGSQADFIFLVDAVK